MWNPARWFASIREWLATASKLLRWRWWRWVLVLYGAFGAYDVAVSQVVVPEPDEAPGLAALGISWSVWLIGGLILLIIALVSGAQRTVRKHQHKLGGLRGELRQKEAEFRRELTEQQSVLLEFQRRGRLLRDRILGLGQRWIPAYGYEADDWRDEVHGYLHHHLPLYAEQFLVDEHAGEVRQLNACFEVQTYGNFMDRRRENDTAHADISHRFHERDRPTDIDVVVIARVQHRLGHRNARREMIDDIHFLEQSP